MFVFEDFGDLQCRLDVDSCYLVPMLLPRGGPVWLKSTCILEVSLRAAIACCHTTSELATGGRDGGC